VTNSFVISGIAGSHILRRSADGRGVELDNSSQITLDQLPLNKMTGNALFINGSSSVNLSNSKLKSTADGQQPHDADGLYALNSEYLNIGGVSACAKVQICNTFDYDTGWGIYLQNTRHAAIDRASANADDTGAFILDNSSYGTSSEAPRAQAGRSALRRTDRRRSPATTPICRAD
jgi:hypothetical protein